MKWKSPNAVNGSPANANNTAAQVDEESSPSFARIVCVFERRRIIHKKKAVTSLNWSRPGGIQSFPELRTVDTVRIRRGSSHVKRALFVDPGLRGWFEISVGVTEDASEVSGLPCGGPISLSSVIDRRSRSLQQVSVLRQDCEMAQSSLCAG